MLTKVTRWGNSQGLRLAKSVLQDAQIEIGDEVDVAVRDGVILIAPARTRRGRHRLEELVAAIPSDYQPGETDWGQPPMKQPTQFPPAVIGRPATRSAAVGPEEW